MGATSPSGQNRTDDRGRAHRVLARIPGLSRLAEQSAPASDVDEQPGADPGWVFHEGGDGSFEGWLYHYADGAMVDAEGVEYVVPGSEAEPEPEPEPEPEAEPEPEP